MTKGRKTGGRKTTARFKVPLPDFNVLRMECYSYGISMGLLSRLTLVSKRTFTMWEKGEKLPDWGKLMRIESVMIVIRRAAIRAGFQQISVMEFMYASKKERIRRQINQTYLNKRKAKEAYNLKVAQLNSAGTTLATERTIESIWPGAERRDVLDPLIGIRNTSRFNWRQVEDSDRKEGHQPRGIPAAREGIPAQLRGSDSGGDPATEGSQPGGNAVGEIVPSSGGQDHLPPPAPPRAARKNPFAIAYKEWKKTSKLRQRIKKL